MCGGAIRTTRTTARQKTSFGHSRGEGGGVDVGGWSRSLVGPEPRRRKQHGTMVPRRLGNSRVGGDFHGVINGVKRGGRGSFTGRFAIREMTCGRAVVCWQYGTMSATVD